jgi:hypothetical protein
VFYNEMLKSLQGYLTVRLDLEPARMNKETVQEKLAGLQIPEQVAKTFLTVWQTCEQAVFAGQARAGDMQTTLQQAEWAVQELDRFFKR